MGSLPSLSSYTAFTISTMNTSCSPPTPLLVPILDLLLANHKGIFCHQQERHSVGTDPPTPGFEAPKLSIFGPCLIHPFSPCFTQHIITVCNSNCRKVRFLHLSVILFIGRWGVSQHALGRGCVSQHALCRGVSAQGGLPLVWEWCTPPGRHTHPPGRHPLDTPLGRHPRHPPRWPLQQMVHILLECILVS